MATVFGIIIGPHVLDLFNPYSWGGADDQITNEITLEVTRVVIALSVFAVGVELPKVSLLRSLLPRLLGQTAKWKTRRTSGNTGGRLSFYWGHVWYGDG